MAMGLAIAMAINCVFAGGFFQFKISDFKFLIPNERRLVLN